MNTTEEPFEISKEEEEKEIRNAFSSLQPLKLKHIPARQKRKYIVLKVIATEFVQGQQYTESQVNEILAGIHEDYGSIRRYLIDYKLLKRTTDGSCYWRE